MHHLFFQFLFVEGAQKWALFFVSEKKIKNIFVKMFFVYVYVLLLNHQTKRKNKDYEKDIKPTATYFLER